jgi:ABC-2 type transport system ATP-binding protein
MADLAIRVRDLHKSYGSLQAVRGIDLEVAEGEVFALLGPNGAGKTTTVEILEGYRERDAGEVSVLGFDPGRGELEYRKRIGIVLQSTAFERYLTVEEIVDLFRGWYPAPRPRDEIIEVVGLEDARHTRVSRLSGGQQRRLDVAIGLAGDPELLFLDEPTTGFDPAARRGAWEMIRRLASLGKTVFLTTHYMDEAEAIAHRVAIIVAGRIVALGAPADLIGAHQTATISFKVPPATIPARLRRRARTEDGWVRLETRRPTSTLKSLTEWAVLKRFELDGLTVTRPDLEDVYLALVGEAEAAP